MFNTNNNSMNWITNDEYIEGTHKNFILKEKIAAFDLDNTLVTPRSNNKFPVSCADWILFSDNIPKKLKSLTKEGYCIVIISNQAGISKGKVDQEEWIKKINNIQKYIGIPIKVFASKGNNVFRKPYPTFWNQLKKQIDVNSDGSFYCGDACGRKGDHSDTDYKFALNVGVKFMLPEVLFDNKNIPEFSRPCHPYENYEPSDVQLPKISFKKKDMIIMVGFPGSGKSTFVENNIIPLGYDRINMDLLKTKTKCIKMCTNSVMSGKSVVIDNTNLDKKSRKDYIDIAKKYKYTIQIMYIDCSDILLCHHSTHYRAHKMFVENNTAIQAIPMVAFYKGRKMFEYPDSKTEGFGNLTIIPHHIPADTDFMLYYF